MVVFLLILGVFIFLVNELILLSVIGFPPKDKDVLEFIKKVRDSDPYLLDGARPKSMIVSNSNPYISKSLRSCLIGCSISDVGGIPRWYKSYEEIQKLYNELGANSGKTKREILGV